MDVFVHIKGYLKNPTPERQYLSHRFTVQNDDSGKICEFINASLVEILQMRGMLVPINPDIHPRGVEAFNNLECWNMDLIERLGIEVKILSAKTPDAVDIASGKTRLN